MRRRFGRRRHRRTPPPWLRVLGRVLTVVQLLLLVATLRDLRRRPADEIRGPKAVWALAAFVNIVGPIAYFAFGRRR